MGKKITYKTSEIEFQLKYYSYIEKLWNILLFKAIISVGHCVTDNDGGFCNWVFPSDLIKILFKNKNNKCS